MTTKIGINGFGRMGRLGTRVAWNRPDLEIQRVNEIATDAAGSAHLLKYDSVHGTWPLDCSAGNNELRIDGCTIRYSSSPDIDTAT